MATLQGKIVGLEAVDRARQASNFTRFPCLAELTLSNHNKQCAGKSTQLVTSLLQVKASSAPKQCAKAVHQCVKECPGQIKFSNKLQIEK